MSAKKHYIRSAKRAEAMTPEEIAARLEEIASMIAQITERQDNIEAMLANPEADLTDEDGETRSVDEIEQEIADLEAELKDAQEEKRSLVAAQSAQKRAVRRAQIASFGTGPAIHKTEKHASESFIKERRTVLTPHEMRSILTSTGTLAKPTGVGENIHDPFNIVSSIVDQVDIQDMTGMGECAIAYQKSYQQAGAATEGTASTASDPVFRTVKIKPSLIDTLSYISREVKKQTPLAYEEKVRNGAILALKKKIAGILISGNTDGAYGVYNAKNTESTPEALADYLDMTDAIGADTLRKIVFNYGGDENVMGYCRLYLSKKDLIAFGDVRGTNEKKAIYEITPDGDNPNTGIIKEGGLIVPYTICSDVTAYTSATGTAAGVSTIIYGDPTCITLGLFGDYEVRVSEEYKFAEKLNSVMGEVTIGCNMTRDKGFLVVRKKAKS